MDIPHPGPDDAQEAAAVRVGVRSLRGGATILRDCEVAVEDPLEIRVARAGDTGPGEPLAVTMRTPGHDVELALGLLYGEGLVRSRADVLAATRGGPDGRVVRIELPPGRVADVARLGQRLYANSACGLCGRASLGGIPGVDDVPQVDRTLAVDASLIRSLDAAVRAAQPLFRRTGGLHAATLFDADGALVASREDVGRHNALDKLVGAMLMQDRLPLARSVLHLSGRASFELLQKAAVAGIPVVASVGAPSSLAVRLAERSGILLAGFLRDDAFNVYAHAERLR